MEQQWIITCLLITCAHISHQVSTPNSENYIAAVVEYCPIIDFVLGIKSNTDAYINYIKAANKCEADIIVFPEKGLTGNTHSIERNFFNWSTIVPSASKNYIPCDENTVEVSDTLKRISCAAKENRIYVVINIPEKIPCNKITCMESRNVYNTNVVFDRNGKIIARYRKTNLRWDDKTDVTEVSEIVTFDTDFGVKFGTFTGYDILFEMPPLHLTRIHQITDIVSPTFWTNYAPYHMALQIQAGWSYAENVNLLVAGYNNPIGSDAGSGIYLGRKGIGKATLIPELHEEMLVHKVPKMKKRTKSYHHVNNSKDANDTTSHQGSSHLHNELWKKREDIIGTAVGHLGYFYCTIGDFETFLLEGDVTKTLCHNNFCCDFEIIISENDPRTRYHLVAFSGIYNFFDHKNFVSICSILHCSDQSNNSYLSTQTSKTVFKNISISATFHKKNLFMPSTLDSDLYLFPMRDWSYNEHIHGNHVHVNIHLTHSRNNIVTFGLFSSDFVKNSARMTTHTIFNKVDITQEPPQSNVESNAIMKASFNTITYFAILLMTLFLSRL